MHSPKNLPSLFHFLLRHSPPQPELSHRAHDLTKKWCILLGHQQHSKPVPNPSLPHFRIRHPRNNDEGDSLYSHAEIVDVKDLLHVPPASDRLATAVTETLDMKPSRAQLALSMFPLLKPHLQCSALQVAEWAFKTAMYRSERATVKELQLSCEYPLHVFPLSQLPKSLPEPLVRFVCAEVNHSTTLRPSATNATADSISLRHNPANAVQLNVPVAIALIGIISTLAALQCTVTKRRRQRPSFLVRCDSSVVCIDVFGDGPTVVLLRRRRTLLTKGAKESADELIDDIISTLNEFESYALHG